MKSTKRNSRINASALMRNELPPVKQFDKAEFAKRLCYTRELAQFPTQQDFAAAIGTVKQTINHYETGERLPNAEVLFKMADCLGCSVDWLLGISDNLHPDNKYIEDVTGLMA